MLRSVARLPLRQFRQSRPALCVPVASRPALSNRRLCRGFSETSEEADEKKRKFGADRVWMGKNMTTKFVSADARRPAPPPTAASLALSASLAAAGVDAAAVAQGLVEHFGSEQQSEAQFVAVGAPAFRALLAEACEEQAPHADEIFEVLSRSGEALDADDLLALLRAGMPMNAPEFEPMVWEEKFETIGKLDGDHVEIFDLMNGVSATLREGPISAVCASMAKVREHSEPHFAQEIGMLRKCPSYEEWVCDYHDEIHRGFIDHVAAFERDLGAQKASAVCDLVSGHSIAYIKEWMLYHMVWVDQPCVYHLEQAGLA